MANSIQPTTDGGYIVVGNAYADIIFTQGTRGKPYSGSGADMLVVKLDAGGNVSWYTFLGGGGNDCAYSVQQTSDGGYIVSGFASESIDSERMQNAPYRNPHSSIAEDMLVVRLDVSGNITWYTYLGGEGGQRGQSIQQTSDGGFILTGYTSATIDPLQGRLPVNPYGGIIDMMVVKLDSEGNVSWYTFLGGAGHDYATSVQQASDGGYVVAGYANTTFSSLQGINHINPYSSGWDMLVVKLDQSGKVSWWTFLGGGGTEQANSIQPTTDGGYIVVGNATIAIDPLQGKSPINPYYGSIDMMAVKLDSEGYVSWYTFLGGGGGESAYSVQQTNDGGYIIAGDSSASIAPERMQNAPCLNPHSGGATIDMLAVRLDSGGNVAWYTFIGGSGTDSARSIHQSSDGGFIVAGRAEATIDSLQGRSPINSYTADADMLVVKLKNDGTL